MMHDFYLIQIKVNLEQVIFFMCGNTAITWRSTKQTLVVTSSNHAEILAIHKASCECVWLRSMTQHIRGTSGLSSSRGTPTILCEDNTACITWRSTKQTLVVTSFNHAEILAIHELN